MRCTRNESRLIQGLRRGLGERCRPWQRERDPRRGKASAPSLSFRAHSVLLFISSIAVPNFPPTHSHPIAAPSLSFPPSPPLSPSPHHHSRRPSQMSAPATGAGSTTSNTNTNGGSTLRSTSPSTQSTRSTQPSAFRSIITSPRTLP